MNNFDDNLLGKKTVASDKDTSDINPDKDSTPIPVFKKTVQYSGLSNQGSTCYLNSLIQSLFMTPEFRLHLLKWKFVEVSHGAKSDCIPFQLQKLFARLQLKIKPAEETKDLTKSFQWDSSEVFHQHDIQELCRKLFEAIEVSMGPEEHNFINELYEGSSSSVVKCQECNKISEKQDKFLDITLPIRNDFDKIYNKSLGMAFKNFLKPELLDKDNQYFCEGCNKKVDALKYMKFCKMPKILFVSLSRFEYDFMIDGRKKINDQVNFPLILNFNNYIKDYDLIEYDQNVDENDAECLLLNSESEMKTKSCEDNSFPHNKYKEKLTEFLKDGPLVYELFSIVIHSGTAGGGHYYAYIKSFEDQKWYSFNDSNVCELNLKDIKDVFGGTSNNSRYSSSSTGYVLMYRQAKSIEDPITIDDSLITEDLKKDIDSENIKIMEEEQRWKERLNNVTLKACYNCVQKQIVMKKTDTIKSLKLKMMKEFELEDKFNTEDVRVRALNQYSNKSLEFYHEEGVTIDQSVLSSYKALTLDMRNLQTGHFEEYDPDLILLKIFNWVDSYENKTEKDFAPDLIKISNKETLSNLKKRICELYNFDFFITPLYIFRKVEISSNNFSIVELYNKRDDLSKELYRSAILDNTQIFVEVKSDMTTNFNSKFDKILSEKLLNFKIKFNFPISPDKKVRSVIDYNMDVEMEVSRNITLKEVKDKIADYLALKPDEFRMRRFNHNGSEIKILKETVKESTNGILSSLSIYVEFGTPTREDDLKINLFLGEYDYSAFKLFPYKLTEIGPLNIDVKWSIAELKKNLIQEIKDKTSLELNSEYVILRESLSDRPARIFHESLIVNDLEFNENKKIIVQEYTKEKMNFTPDQLQTLIRFWDVEQWDLSEAFEIHLNKGSKLLELAGLICQKFPHIHPEHIGIYKIVNGFNVYMDDINRYEFINIYEKCDSTINHFPFFLTGPGNLFIMRDMSQSIKEPSEEKLKFYTKPQTSSCNALAIFPQANKPTAPSSSLIADRVKMLEQNPGNFLNRMANVRKTKETGITIKVKKNKEEVKQDNNINGEKKSNDVNKGDKEYFEYEENEEFGPLI